MRAAATVIVSVLVVVACTRQKDTPPAVTASPTAHAGFIPTQEQIDRFLAEGPEPTLRKIAATDYWLHYKLMQATGIEKELGGEALAIEALKALGDAYESRLRVAENDLPKMVPTAFTGEGMSSGFIGMGMGGFLGIITGGMTSNMVSSMSDQQLAELNKAGPIKNDGGGGKSEMQFAKDGSLTQSMEFDVSEHGVNGKVKMQSKMSACPDANGQVTVDIEVDSQMSVIGKPGTGGRVHTQFKYQRYLDDDAHLITTDDGAASNLHVRMGGIENFESQSADMTVGYERGGKPILVEHEEQGYSIFRMDEVERTMKLLQSTQLLQTLMAEVMLRGMGSGGSAWESGHCIDLKASSDPAKRKRIRPNTAFELLAIPRTKSDGVSAGGTVTATLTGGSSLQPASGKVRADAKYGYSGPEKKDEAASIAFESRSKRGVGKATLEFDTKAGNAYRMEGEASKFPGVGEVCDLEKSFTVQGGGVTFRFEPGSRAGGQFNYSGAMSGFRVHGTGTYVVNFVDEVAVSIIVKGPGTVETPFGPQTREGTETYTLTPLGESACADSP